MVTAGAKLSLTVPAETPETKVTSGAVVCVGVGGCFEMVSGIVPRAPGWIQSIGCEWIYRLGREPRRMWRRYLVGNLEFAIILMQQALARGPRSIPSTAPATSSGDRA
jgi:hypothetical protein